MSNYTNNTLCIRFGQIKIGIIFFFSESIPSAAYSNRQMIVSVGMDIHFVVFPCLQFEYNIFETTDIGRRDDSC